MEKVREALVAAGLEVADVSSGNPRYINAFAVRRGASRVQIEFRGLLDVTPPLPVDHVTMEALGIQRRVRQEALDAAVQEQKRQDEAAAKVRAVIGDELRKLQGP